MFEIPVVGSHHPFGENLFPADIFIIADVSKSPFEIAKDRTEKVGGKHTGSIKNEYSLNAKKIQLVAEDELSIKVGKAEIVLKKNGDITMKGKKINVKGSGDIILKGSKIKEN